MEEVKMEQQTAADPRKNRYVVDIRRDKAMMMKYIKFYNRVKHPRVTFNLVMTGILLALVPTPISSATAWAPCSLRRDCSGSIWRLAR